MTAFFGALPDPVNLIIGAVTWLVGLAAIVLIFSKESGAFYQQPPALR